MCQTNYDENLAEAIEELVASGDLDEGSLGTRARRGR